MLTLWSSFIFICIQPGIESLLGEHQYSGADVVLKPANIIPAYEIPGHVHLGIHGEDRVVKRRSGIVEITVISMTRATTELPLHRPLGCTLRTFCVLHNDPRT